MLPLTYYGGKVNKSPWLLSLFPSAYDVYLEPFIGSGAVLSAKQRQGLEVVNDLDSEVATFHRVCRDYCQQLQTACRDDANLDRFVEVNTVRVARLKQEHGLRGWDAIVEEPKTLAEWERNVSLWALQQQKQKGGKSLSDTDKAIHVARCYLTSNRQAFAGSLYSPTWKGGHGVVYINEDGKGSVRHDEQSQQTEAALKARWLNIVDRALPWWSRRLQGVFITNSTYAIQLETFNAPGTFAYLDPPYYFPTRQRREHSYRHELTDAQHVELLHRLLDFKGKVALSGYSSRLYDGTLTRGRGWRRAQKKYRTNMDGEKGSERLEVVWMNY